MIVRSLVLAAALAGAVGPVAAEPDLGRLPLRATLPGETDAAPAAAPTPEPVPPQASPVLPPSRECGTQAALYGAGAQKVWVTRIGTVSWRNPLRPMAPESLQVVQVAVNGRAGSAYGPDFETLQQGDPAGLGGADPVRWAGALGDVPPTLRVIADDGRVLVGPLDFVSCGAAPKVARTSARPERRRAVPDEGQAPERSLARPPAEGARATRREAPRAPGLPMPQGAIP